MRHRTRVPTDGQGPETDMVARMIAARSAALRCTDAAEEIFPARDDLTRHDRTRYDPAPSALRRERAESRESTYAGGTHSA
jgi:hypothetical protein